LTTSAGILQDVDLSKQPSSPYSISIQETPKAIAVGPYEIAMSSKPPEKRFPPIITYTQASTRYSIEIYLPFPFLQLPEEICEMMYRELFRNTRVTAAVSYDSQASKRQIAIDNSHCHP
jgi:hypothetical protein